MCLQRLKYFINKKNKICVIKRDIKLNNCAVVQKLFSL